MDEPLYVIFKFQFDFALEVWFSICFGCEVRKIIFRYALLSGGLILVLCCKNPCKWVHKVFIMSWLYFQCFKLNFHRK